MHIPDEEVEELEDIIIQEGDEDVEYVVVELSADIGRRLMEAGTSLMIEGLDTDAPILRLPDGKALSGCYDEHLGSIIVFQEPSGLDAGGALQYRCHTEKKLHMSWAAQLVDLPSKSMMMAV